MINSIIKKNLIILLILIIIIIFIIINFLNKNQNEKMNICNYQLTDNEFLKHMITHHEVAVYMSEKHLDNTHNPQLLNILRNIIRIQNYEINMMKDMINNDEYGSFKDKMSDNTIHMNKMYYSSQGDFTKPNTLHLSNTYCDPSFFNINNNVHHNKMTDDSYIQHMIPHHQIAVDMSKKILKTTTNDFIIYLSYRIIRNQQLEIYELDNISKSNYKFNSVVL